jgi:hypothetical protein
LFGCRVAGSHASTGFAYPERRRPNVPEALRAVLGCWEVAPVFRIARVIGAHIIVVTDHEPEVTDPVHVVARVIGACVGVFAHDVFAEVLSAHAGYTDAGEAIKGAVRSVDHRSTHTLCIAPPTFTTAILVGAFVAVAWAHDTLTGLAIKQGAETPYPWNHAQRAEAGDPKQVARGRRQTL